MRYQCHWAAHPGGRAGTKSGNSQLCPLPMGMDSRRDLFFSREGSLATLEAGSSLGNELCSLASGKSQEVDFVLERTGPSLGP